MPRFVTANRVDCRICLLCGLVILVLLDSHAITSSSAAGSLDGLPTYIDEHSVPTAEAGPLAITVDRHGVVWFTESNASKIASFDPVSSSFNEYLIPGVGDMWGITIDHDDYVWFTQYSGRGSVNPRGSIMAGGHGRLGRLNPATANVTFVEIPTVGSFPFWLVADQENRIWFTELLGNRTGVYDQTTRNLTEYKVSEKLSGPADLTFDQEGSLWFTESFAGKLVRFNPENKMLTEFLVLPQVFSPVGISIDKQGHLWTADHGGNWIAEFDPQTKTLIRYPTHTIHGDLTIPNGLLIDRAGKVWFSEHVGNSIGYFDPRNQTMVEFKIPTGPVSGVLWIAEAPNGDIWFTEWNSNKIGVVHANVPIPISLQPSQKQLHLQSAEETSISLTVETSQDIGQKASFQYSWGTYNPNEITVLFSRQSVTLTRSADASVEVNLNMSSTSRPGNYTLSLGIDAGSIMVWTMVQLQLVSAAGGPGLEVPPLLMVVPILLLAGACALFFVRRGRKRLSAESSLNLERSNL